MDSCYAGLKSLVDTIDKQTNWDELKFDDNIMQWEFLHHNIDRDGSRLLKNIYTLIENIPCKGEAMLKPSEMPTKH